MLKNSQTYLKHLALFTIAITLLNNNNNKRADKPKQLFKVKDGDTKTMCEICLKLTLQTPE